MGVLHFLVPRRDRVGANAAQRAYFAGMDEVPWTSRIRWNEHGLVLERDEFESGNFFVPVCRRRSRRTDALDRLPDGAGTPLSPARRAGPRNAQPPAQSSCLFAAAGRLASGDHLRSGARAALSQAVTHQADLNAAADFAEQSIADIAGRDRDSGDRAIACS